MHARSTAFALTAGSALALIGLVTARAADPKPPTLHDVMKKVVAVQTQVIWDIGNQALDEKGVTDPAKLKPADWARIVSAGGQAKQVMQPLTQGPVVVAAPGQKIDGEGTSGAWGAKQVQKAIDGNPAVFRAFAQQLLASMDEIVAAGQARDAAKFADVSGRLDQVCEQCHLQFWYPEQQGPR